MIINFLVLIIFLLAIILLARIIWRHLPELKVLDLTSIPQEKKTDTKIKILENKFKRQTQEIKEKLNITTSPLKEKFVNLIEKINIQAKNLEKKYQKNNELNNFRNKSINELFAEAQKYLEDEDYSAAEKALIEIIARDKKDLRAYDLLAKIYRFQKNYDQAIEVIKYIIKLQSLKYRKNKYQSESQLKRQKLEEIEETMIESAHFDTETSRFYDDLGEVYALAGKLNKALDSYLKANVIDPNNPKYLDKIIEL